MKSLSSLWKTSDKQDTCFIMFLLLFSAVSLFLLNTPATTDEGTHSLISLFFRDLIRDWVNNPTLSSSCRSAWSRTTSAFKTCSTGSSVATSRAGGYPKHSRSTRTKASLTEFYGNIHSETTAPHAADAFGHHVDQLLRDYPRSRFQRRQGRRWRRPRGKAHAAAT